MKLTQHPQYQRYVWDRETDRRCRQALSAWKASGEPLTYPNGPSQVWTFERVRRFARQLSEMVQEYNRVLWEQFPYCRHVVGNAARNTM